MKKTLIGLGLMVMSVPPAVAETVTVKGSDTMVILNQRWAEAFMKKNPDITIQTTGGGSGTGIAALLNGTTDIAASSRDMKDKEREKLRERYNVLPVEIPVAKDGLSIYVNEANPVQSLSVEQVHNIYTGKITNWKEVGGPDAKIVLYGRENNSGTYVFFKEHVLNNKDFSPRTQTLPGTGAVVNAVAKDKNGIGYGGGAYGKGVKEISISHGGGPAVAPSTQTVADGSYPLARNLYFYLRATPAGAVKKFIDFVLSKEGQEIVRTVGYFPIR